MTSKNSTVADFEAWMRSVGIVWNADAISITDATASSASTMLCSGLALGITTARDIKEGDELCPVIPKSACICPLTCSIADILEKEELNSGLGLVIAVMHEASLGTESTWAGYFASMPHREYLPVFWNKNELEALQGTELENAINEDLANVADDYNTHVVPLLTTYSDRFRAESCTLHHFHYAASLVASRMFGIDDVHGAGMVPLADIFNHKASVVDLAPGYAVHGMSESDEEESGSEEEDGSEDEEEESEDDEGGEENEEEEEQEHDHHHDHHHHNDDKSNGAGVRHTIMRKNTAPSADENPTTTLTDDSVAVHALHGISKVNGLHLALEIAILDGGDHLQIVAASDISVGIEVHNTYGELSNDVLVKKYGFALRYNPFNAVQLKKDDVINACKQLYIAADEKEQEEEDNEGSEPAAKKTKRGGGGGGRSSKQKKNLKQSSSPSEKVFTNLLKILEDETDLLTEEDGEEPFELLPNGHIGPALFATLRVLCSGVENLKNAATSLDDALRIETTQDGEEGSVLDPGSIRAVQIFPVVDEEGKLLSNKELTRTAAAAKALLSKTPEDSKMDISSLTTADTTSLTVTPAMCTALLAAVQQRMAKYPTNLEETIIQLENFENEILKERTKAASKAPKYSKTVDDGDGGSSSSAALSEGQSAARAALTLRLTEQEILKGIETAAKIRLNTKF